MFDVSWVDPERETVGERKTRKQQRSTCASRDGLRPPSQPPSTQSSASERPPSRNVFGPSTLYVERGGLTRGGKQPRSSSALRLDGPRQTSYTASSDSSFQETPRTSTTMARTPETEFFSDSYKSDYEQSRLSSQSEDSGTNSTSSLNAESISSTRKIVQHLSPTSFVTQSTEITVSPREAIKDTEQSAVMVHISASGTVHVHDSATSGRRPSQAAILDFLNDILNDNSSDDNDEKDTGEDESSTPDKIAEIQHTPLSPPNWWEPPEAWGCSKPGIVKKKDIPVSSKTRRLGLPFRPATAKTEAKGEGVVEEGGLMNRGAGDGRTE